MRRYASIAKTCDFLAIQKKLGYRILSYVGNITENKKQIELVQLMLELRDKKVIAVLAGREADEGQVRKYIVDHDLSEPVILVGFCAEMDSIWENTDLNVFLSKNDGLPLCNRRLYEGHSVGYVR